MNSKTPVSTRFSTVRRTMRVRREDAPDDLEVELLMSTHLTIVVRARIEVQDGQGDPHLEDAALVISRRRCRGDRPTRTALVEAARDCLGQLAQRALGAPGAVVRLLARVNGRWQPLLPVDEPGQLAAA